MGLNGLTKHEADKENFHSHLTEMASSSPSSSSTFILLASTFERAASKAFSRNKHYTKCNLPWEKGLLLATESNLITTKKTFLGKGQELEEIFTIQ